MRIFYGKVNTQNGGVRQLNDNYLTGSNKWFGDLKENDIAIISEDSQIMKIRKVAKIEELNDNEKKYIFNDLVEMDLPKKPGDIVYTKYFKFNIASAINAYRQNAQNFNELVLNDEYKNIDIENLTFENDAFNTIYVTTNIKNIKNIESRDYVFLVSSEEKGYMLQKIYNVLPNLNLKEISLSDISPNLNIDKYGFMKAYEIEKNKTFKKINHKQTKLKNIINDLETKGYYEHLHAFGLVSMYDILIVNEHEKASKKKVENEKSIEDVNDENNNIDLKIYNIDNHFEKVNDECAYNQIFYGAPGCGKSYKVKKILEANNIEEENYVRILFHPEYTYTDFVGQMMPKDNSFEFKPGPFAKILKKALLDGDNTYVLIIDEINRGNAPAIFGDVFQLFERDADQKSEYTVCNDDIKNYLNDEKDGGIVDCKNIYLPNNLYLFATMNTSDQNVFTLDTAFKRRWYFEKISNIFDDDDEFGKQRLFDTDITWKEFQSKINEIITNRLPDYGLDGEDKQLGKYFVTKEELNNKIKFAHKVLMYLWEDVVKIDRTILFKDKYKTLDKVMDDFMDNNIGMGIFSFNEDDNEAK